MLSTFKYLCRTRHGIITHVFRKGVATTCVDKSGGIQNVTVIGGGVMGAGIAQVSAQNGFNVVVVANDEYSQKCMVSIWKSLDIISKKRFPTEPKSAKTWTDGILGNIQTTQKYDIGCENADLIIESVVEDLDIKKGVFQKIDPLIPQKAIVASNTSSLSIEEMSLGLQCADRFLGVHFFNPVWHMKLVEVIATNQTSENAMNAVLSYVSDIGKTAVKCADNPGFIVNHMLYPYLMESLRFMESGHASVADIDSAMKLGAGLPLGPFELIDIIGLDTVQQVISTWNQKYPDDPRFFPSETINEMVRQKKLGMKTKQGFYAYKHTLF